MKQTIRQTFRIYPTKKQEAILVQWLGCGRFVWNHYLERNIKQYQENQKFIFNYDINLDITQLKKESEYSWLRDTPAQVLQQKSADLDSALRNMFRHKRGFPRFKSRHTDTSGIRFPQAVSIADGKLHLPKMKSGIKLVQHRDFLGTPGACTVYKRPCGHWYVSFVVKGYEIPDKVTDINYDYVVGLDLGLKSFLVTSDAEIIKNEKFLHRTLTKLRRAQQRLSRKQKGSNNRYKQRIRVARVHEKIKNQRKNFVTQIANLIAKNYDLVVIEDLNVKSMVQNRNLSRQISDVGWGMFASALKWQCAKQGKHLIQIGRFEPSTKTCSRCGYRQPMPLELRIFDCENCNLVIDRDLNAAINIKNLGLKKFDTEGTSGIYACGNMSRSLDHSAQETAIQQ